MTPISRKEYETYVRNFIFGVEDSLVSTVGLLSGVAVADVSRGTILLTGIVLIFVEAFSMGMGSYLSENSVEHLEQGKSRSRTSIVGGGVMFASYLVAGLIPLFPYVLFERSIALWWSVVCSLVGLFVLGTLTARLVRAEPIKKGLYMLLLGGLVIVAGMIIGKLVKGWGI